MRYINFTETEKSNIKKCINTINNMRYLSNACIVCIK